MGDDSSPETVEAPGPDRTWGAGGSERYTTKPNALNGINSARTNAATPARFDRRTSIAGEPYFLLKARNGEPIGRSEMYTSKNGRDKRIQSVATNAPVARIDDLTD